MPNCVKCHQPQTTALVICRSCYRALTERTVSMETDKLIKDLRRNGLGNGTSLGHHSGLCDVAADCIEDLAAQLAEKDKQLSLAEDFIHRVGPDAMEAYRLFSGQQEAGEVSQTQTAPAWAEQFERRFMAGEGGG